MEFKKVFASIIIIFGCFSFVFSQKYIEKNFETTIRVWGVLKYYSPYVYNKKINWDELLLNNYVNVRNARDHNSFNKIISVFIDTVFKKTNINTNISKSTEYYIKTNNIQEIENFSFLRDSNRYVRKPDFSWILTDSLLSANNKERLIEIIINYKPKGKNLYLKEISENIIQPIESNYCETTIIDGKVLTIPEEYRFLAFARFWNIINYLYPYKQILNIDWDGFLKTKSVSFIQDEYYYNSIYGLITSLSDGHARINLNQIKLPKSFVKPKTLNSSFFIPFTIKILNNSVFVENLADSNICLKGDIKLGDKIEKIGKLDSDSLINKMKQYYSYSNDNAYKNIAETDFHYWNKQDSIFDVKILRDHTMINATILGISYEKYKKSFMNINYHKLINDSTDYINIAAPTKIFIEYLKAAIGKNIILDLRDYPTENNSICILEFLSKEAIDVANYFYPSINYPGTFISAKESLTFRNKRKQLPKPYRSHDYHWANNTSGYTTFKKKLIVLIDGSTMSQSETLCMLIKTYYPNAIFVGTQTAGTNGDMVDNVCIPGGVSLSYSAVDFHYANGKQTQRLGIIPDIYFEESLENLKKGEDGILETAILIINK